MELSPELLQHYSQKSSLIKQRLSEFRAVPRDEYFYELCFCLCTPQSKASSAIQVQNKLKAANFYSKRFDPVYILSDKQHYIRFHNQKSKRLLDAIDLFPTVLSIIDSNNSPKEKRLSLNSIIKGMGMKECSHFLRNIGFSGLSILDRHILKHLVKAGLFPTTPNISSIANYLSVEKKFERYAELISIPIDEIDLMFWSYENGEIIK